jgi:hypothetical protein
MKNTYQLIALIIVLIILPVKSFAWGSKGHAIVAEIAFAYLDANTKKVVLEYLDGMTIQEASTWMDNMKDDHSYDYMKPHHYVNFDKGEQVVNNPGANIISVLSMTINQLKLNKKLSKDEIKQKICIIFHLIGDLHQPLHVGYGDDKGGNQMQINFNGSGTNLHSFFDSGIIKYKNITAQDCLNANRITNTQLNDFQTIDVLTWATQSRSYLDSIYNFEGHKLSEEYIDANALIIKSELFKAGLRLAAVLKEVFKN